MIVNERFRSIQGEGPCIGYPSTFIRFSKCVLNCPFCDSKHTWTDEDCNTLINTNEKYTELVDYINAGPKHIVFTGGEPLINCDDVSFKSLILEMVHSGKDVTFETTLLSKLEDMKMISAKNAYHHMWEVLGESVNLCRFMVSPKMDIRCYGKGITEEDIIKFYSIPKHVSDKFNRLQNVYYKIVYDDKYQDIIFELIRRLDNDWVKEHVYFMPLTPEPFNNQFDKYQESCKQTVEFCMQHEFKYSPRTHIDIYGGTRGV